MKLKDVNLNIPHYVVEINASTNHIFVTKAKRSIIQKFKYKIKHYVYKSVDFYIYPELEKSYSYIAKRIVTMT